MSVITSAQQGIKKEGVQMMNPFKNEGADCRQLTKYLSRLASDSIKMDRIPTKFCRYRRVIEQFSMFFLNKIDQLATIIPWLQYYKFKCHYFPNAKTTSSLRIRLSSSKDHQSCSKSPYQYGVTLNKRNILQLVRKNLYLNFSCQSSNSL